MSVTSVREVFLAAIPKSNTIETRVAIKEIGSRGSAKEYLEFREYWFNQGPSEPPVPTKKGCMIESKHRYIVIHALLLEAVNAKVLTREQVGELMELLQR